LCLSVFSIYSVFGLFISNSMIPLTTLPNSTKFVSVVAVGVNLASVRVNLSLSAPGEFSFVIQLTKQEQLILN
jgi:hypothetical protein